MTGKQVGWFVVLAISFVYVIAAGIVVYESGALGASALWIKATVSAVAVVAGLFAFLGSADLIRKAAKDKSVAALNNLFARLAIIAGCLGAGTIFACMYSHYVPPPLWTCKVKKVGTMDATPSRCPDGKRAGMRVFVLELRYAGALASDPVLRVAARHPAASFARVESERPGCSLYVDENKLPLVSDCGEDGHYEVHLVVCDAGTKVLADPKDVGTTVALSMTEEATHVAKSIECE